MKITEALTKKALQKGIITADQTEVFIYCLDKRVSSLMVGIPCFLLAVAISDFWGAIAFNASFFLIRKYSNGFHANTVLNCLISSIFCEFVFLGLIYPVLSPIFVLAGVILSSLAIFFLAPYNHPAFDYSSEEITACRKHALIRTTVLSALALVAMAFNIPSLSKGISLGCAMAGASLCFAYLIDWRKTYGNPKDQDGNASQQSSKRDDGF
jgi:accessory gene regulator B